MMEFANERNEFQVYSGAELGTMNIGGAEYLMKWTNRDELNKKEVIAEKGITNISFSLEGKRYVRLFQC